MVLKPLEGPQICLMEQATMGVVKTLNNNHNTGICSAIRLRLTGLRSEETYWRLDGLSTSTFCLSTVTLFPLL